VCRRSCSTPVKVSRVSTWCAEHAAMHSVSGALLAGIPGSRASRLCRLTRCKRQMRALVTC
jgi:hypothetical protein